MRSDSDDIIRETPTTSGICDGIVQTQQSHLRSVEQENSSQRSNDCCLVILKEIRLDSLYFRCGTISELVEQKRSEFSEKRAGGLGFEKSISS